MTSKGYCYIDEAVKEQQQAGARIKYSKRCHKINNIRNQINILAKSKKKEKNKRAERANQTRTSDCVYKIDCVCLCLFVCVCVCWCVCIK